MQLWNRVNMIPENIVEPGRRVIGALAFLAIVVTNVVRIAALLELVVRHAAKGLTPID